MILMICCMLRSASTLGIFREKEQVQNSLAFHVDPKQNEWEEASVGSSAPSVEAGLLAARTFACASIDARRCARPCSFGLSFGLFLY